VPSPVLRPVPSPTSRTPVSPTSLAIIAGTSDGTEKFAVTVIDICRYTERDRGTSGAAELNAIVVCNYVYHINVDMSITVREPR